MGKKYAVAAPVCERESSVVDAGCATNAGNACGGGYIAPLDPFHPLPPARFKMKFPVFAALVAGAMFAGIAVAQDPEQEGTGGGQDRRVRIPFWKAVLPGGAYVVRLDSIGSVSLQRYVLDGTAQVTELNITTPGVMQPRFYHIEPLPGSVPSATAQAAIDQRQEQATALARDALAGDSPFTKVVKSYPTTTHAGTIEYRLESRAQIEELYQSLERAWMTRRSETFALEGAADPGSSVQDAQGDSVSE